MNYTYDYHEEKELKFTKNHITTNQSLGLSFGIIGGVILIAFLIYYLFNKKGSSSLREVNAPNDMRFIQGDLEEYGIDINELINEIKQSK